MNELVKEQLEAVGFKVDLEPMDWNALIGVFLAGAKKYDYNAINFSMAPIDPVQGILKKWTTPAAPPNCCNWGFFKDAEMDEMGQKALAEFDPVKRNAILTAMNERAVRRGVGNVTSSTTSTRARSRPSCRASFRRRAGFRT